MTEMQIRIGRIVVLGTWVICAASFFFPLYGWATGPLFRAMFGILVAVHLVEFLVYLKTFRATGEPLFGHFLKTMTYGVLHYTEVKQRLARSAE